MSRFAGINISGNYVHLAGIDWDDGAQLITALPGSPNRIEIALRDGSLPADLVDLKDRIRMDLRDWQVEGVAVVQTAKNANWVYSHAFTRAAVVSAVMIASVEGRIQFTLVKAPKIGAALQHPKLETLPPGRFGLQAGEKYWTTGLREAYAAAAYLPLSR